MSADDIKPILSAEQVDRASRAEAGEDPREHVQRILAAAFHWAEQREVGPSPAKRAWEALTQRIRAEFSMVMDNAAPSPQGDAPALPAMDTDLVEILGRPNFACRDIANVLRRGGREIPHKSEHEQAHVLHYLLGFKIRYGADWWTHARDELQRIIDAASSTPAKGDA